MKNKNYLSSADLLDFRKRLLRSAEPGTVIASFSTVAGRLDLKLGHVLDAFEELLELRELTTHPEVDVRDDDPHPEITAWQKTADLYRRSLFNVCELLGVPVHLERTGEYPERLTIDALFTAAIQKLKHGDVDDGDDPAEEPYVPLTEIIRRLGNSLEQHTAAVRSLHARVALHQDGELKHPLQHTTHVPDVATRLDLLRYQLRPGVWIQLELPKDFDTLDAERIAEWAKAIALPVENLRG